MVRGRRPRIATAPKGQLKIGAAIVKKDCKPMQKLATTTGGSCGGQVMTCNSTTIQTITQRTRNLRKSLHKIQKQFDNQAITKFFQRTLKAQPYQTREKYGGSDGGNGSDDTDDNVCDTFATDQLHGTIGQVTDDQIGANQSTNLNSMEISNFNHKQFETSDTEPIEQQMMDNANSHTSIQSTNIFLQKPVLHLNIDKTSLMQASSIVINKHLDACPNFAAASFPTTFLNSACVLNTANMPQEVASKSSEDESCAEQNGAVAKANGETMKCEKQRIRRRRPRKCANRWTDDSGSSEGTSGHNDGIDSDSNSCDSGVVSDRSFELSSTDGTKPTTPHRIVCTSTTATPTNEDIPKISSPINANRIVGIKRNAIKRAKGKSAQKGQSINTAKSYFTKLIAVANAQSPKTDNTIESVDNLKVDNDADDDDGSGGGGGGGGGADDDDDDVAKVNVDCEMSALNIASNDNETSMKNVLPKPMSRSSTPLQAKPMQSKQMTDFYPVRRRSVRKTKKAVEQEYLRNIEKAIEQQSEDGLVVKLFKDKGRGICAGRPFARGEFVVEYIGDLIEQAEADRREEIYAKDTAFGCYMYYFKHKEQQWCIDATAETGKLGRLVNHSRNGNLVTKIVTYKNRPHLVLIAKENIKEGEELTYDYGDRTRESLVNHPWLAL